MGSIDGLREQVEELKQRLNDPGSQKTPESGELKTRLASIKASLESKQGEIDQLSAEKGQLAADKEKLAAEKEKLAAEREMLAAEREKISTEKQQLSADNDQLRKMLKEVLSALDGQPADASTKILSEFLAETDPLVKPNGVGPETVIAAGPPADLADANPAKAEPAGDAPKAAGQKNAPQQEPESDGEGADEEESPALRRIMRRGHRAAG
jgi:DNA repair exonuclease SbcCD ATPase subunit